MIEKFDNTDPTTINKEETCQPEPDCSLSADLLKDVLLEHETIQQLPKDNRTWILTSKNRIFVVGNAMEEKSTEETPDNKQEEESNSNNFNI